MGGYKDGFKRGTNYCHRSRMANYDPAAELAAALTLQATQSEKCARGEHDVAEVDPKRVTYVRGRRLAIGTKWCRWCSVILVQGDGPVP